MRPVMRPMYDADGVSIWNADCREWLWNYDPKNPAALRPQFDFIVTDPPYGTDIVRADGHVGSGSLVYRSVVGDKEPFDPALLLALGVPTILWGGNHYAPRLPASACWLVWDKREGATGNDFADCELAWTNLRGPARLYHHYWNGGGTSRQGERIARVHPTQKPLELMRWCLGLLPTIIDHVPTILDPYMGSGTTLRAAKDLGYRAVGIEVDGEYCEFAARRMGQGVFDIA